MLARPLRSVGVAPVLALAQLALEPAITDHRDAQDHEQEDARDDPEREGSGSPRTSSTAAAIAHTSHATTPGRLMCRA